MGMESVALGAHYSINEVKSGVNKVKLGARHMRRRAESGAKTYRVESGG